MRSSGYRKCRLHLSCRIRAAHYLALNQSAADWHSHEFNLPVLKEGRPSSKRGFCVRDTVAEKSQTVRANGRSNFRSHGQSVSDPGACPVRDRGHVHGLSVSHPRPICDRIRVRILTGDSSRSNREPTVSQCLDWPGNVRAAALSFPV